MTADKMDEGQESTEKVEKTGELQQASDGQPTWSRAHGTAHRRRRRPASRRQLVGPSSVGGPNASVSSRSTVRMRSPTFRWSEASLRAWSAARSLSSWRATELHRQQDEEEILAKTRAEEAAEAAVRAAGEAKQRAEATQDAMEKAALAQLRAQWSRPPGLLATRMVDMGVQTSLVSDLSILAWKPVQQVVGTTNLEKDVVKNDKPLVEVDPAVVWALRRAVKGATHGDLRGERAKGEGGVGEEVDPEGEEEKGGEGAERRARE